MNEKAEVKTEFVLPAACQEQFQQLVSRYPTKDSCLMPALWLIQDEYGYVAALGWEGKGWGLEFKYAYLDPSLFSFVAYYHF